MHLGTTVTRASHFHSLARARQPLAVYGLTATWPRVRGQHPIGNIPARLVFQKNDAKMTTDATRNRLDPAVLAWLRLARVFQKVQQASAESLRADGLSVGQFDVLAQVGASEGMSQQEVAESLLVTKSNVCQLLDRMEDAGLVERRQQGRTKRLFLTPAGRRLFARVVPAQEARIAELFSALSTEEELQLLGTLRRLDRALG